MRAIVSAPDPAPGAVAPMRHHVVRMDAPPAPPDRLLDVPAAPAPEPVAAPGADPRPGRRAWTIWAAAVCVYLVAVFHRSSLGVAGIVAAHRFGIGASQLAAFTVLQLVVYAGMQIPVGVLVDRHGPRRLLTCGLIAMTTAQLAFSLSGSFATALAARALLCCGDAMTFVSVLRLIAAWFPARRTPLVTQLTGFTGTAGNLASAYPLALALRDFGWTPTYLAAALAGGSALLLPLLVIRDRPAQVGSAAAGPPAQASEPEAAAVPAVSVSIPHPRASEPEPQRQPEPRPTPTREPVLTQLRAGWARTGTRLGFWVHFTTPFAGGVFSLLWGYPFLVQGEGVSPGTASGLLTLMVAEAMLLGPLYGTLTGRRPRLRMPLTATVVTLTATAWAAVLLYPGRAPLWLVTALVVALGTGGPASLVGFEVARDANPRRRVGTVSGMVNVGGFSAMVLLLIGIGFVLDASGGDGAGHYTLAGFKAAFACQYLL